MDCSELPGRLREICDGTARKANGQPFTDVERKTIVSRRLKTTEVTVEPYFEGCLLIGDRMHEIILRETGARIECSQCRDEINRMNHQTAFDVLSQKEELAKRIVERAKTRAPNWWQRWGAKIAPDYAKAVVLEWIHEACGVAKDFKGFDEKPMQFLYFYIPGPDNGFELQHSIRSVEKNFIGKPHITIIGDRPSWYTGHMIPLPKLAARRAVKADRMAFMDTQHKISTAVNHAELQDEFVWMMDDVFLLQPTTIEDLKTPRIDPWYRSNRAKEWHRLIAATFIALRSKGKPNLQYGTHLPHHFEKQKMLELFELYNYPRQLYLFEILYGNHFRTDPIPYGNEWQGVQYHAFLRRLLKRPKTVQEMDTLVGQSNVLNYQAVCYCNPIKAWLEKKFPEKSGVET